MNSVSPVSITRFLTDPELLGRDFAGPSWDAARITLKATFGEALTVDEIERFRALAGRNPPNRRVRRLWLGLGRRAGKDVMAAAIATYLGVFGNFQKHLRRGERASIVCLAVDRQQSAVAFGYIRGMFETVPLLRGMLVSARDDTIMLTNGVEIIVATNSFRGIRGRTIACAIFDEVAFWRDADSANPDIEVYNAILPSMITLRDAGAMIIGISSVHRKAGLLYEQIQKYLGKDDPDTLAILAPSVAFNPTLAEPDAAAEIEQALLLDPERASAEWLSLWRADLLDMFDRELVAAAIDQGVTIRFPRRDLRYQVACDPSGGRGDSFTAAAGHVEGTNPVIDRVYERRAPFDPETALDEVAELARDYGVTTVHGDDYGADLIVSSFRKRGITYRNIAVRDDVRHLPGRMQGQQARLNRSEVYLNSLPLFSAGRVRLVDNPRLIHQLVSLERRAVRSGHDIVDHPRSGADDIANSVCACLVTLAGARPDLRVGPELLARIRGGGAFVPPSQPPPAGSAAPAAPRGRLHVSDALLARSRAASAGTGVKF
jgi:hypothetical protein